MTNNIYRFKSFLHYWPARLALEILSWYGAGIFMDDHTKLKGITFALCPPVVIPANAKVKITDCTFLGAG